METDFFKLILFSSCRVFLPSVDSDIYKQIQKSNDLQLLLETLLIILERMLLEDFQGFVPAGPVQVQQLLEGVCGQLHPLAHLLVIVGDSLLQCSRVLFPGQGYHCILYAGQSTTVDGIDVGQHQAFQTFKEGRDVCIICRKGLRLI